MLVFVLHFNCLVFHIKTKTKQNKTKKISTVMCIWNCWTIKGRLFCINQIGNTESQSTVIIINEMKEQRNKNIFMFQLRLSDGDLH